MRTPHLARAWPWHGPGMALAQAVQVDGVSHESGRPDSVPGQGGGFDAGGRGPLTEKGIDTTVRISYSYYDVIHHDVLVLARP
jgi:hypothetical protein